MTWYPRAWKAGTNQDGRGRGQPPNGDGRRRLSPNASQIFAVDSITSLGCRSLTATSPKNIATINQNTIYPNIYSGKREFPEENTDQNNDIEVGGTSQSHGLSLCSTS